MRNLWLGLAGGAIVSCVTSGALADGMPQYGRAAVRDCANFHGFYVGANGGWTQLTASQNNLDGYRSAGTTDVATSFTATDSGFAGGGQVGFNLQRHCTVFGLEADWSWARVDAETNVFPHSPNPQNRISSSIDSFGTLRTRSGIIVDHTLLYLTGGLAWANTPNKVDFRNALGTISEHNSWSDSRWGWTAGTGIEHALSHNISIKSEVLYMALGENTHDITGVAVTGAPGGAACAGGTGNCRYKIGEDTWVTRIGLNFRFGGDREVGPLK